MKRASLYRFVPAVLAALALGAGVTPQAFAQALSSAVVEYRQVDRLAIAEGIVEAVRQSTLAAQVAGRVISLPVKAGDTVKAGQVLVQIDPRSAAQQEAVSQSQVREAQANLDNTKAKYVRSQRLFAQKFISQAALDQAQAEYLAAQAQTAASVASAGVATTSKSFTTITAPYAGVVASTEVEVGDMAMAGRPLVTVFDPAQLRVVATLPQTVLAEAKLDRPVAIEIPTLKRTLSVRRVTVIPVADSRTHTTQVRLDLAEAAGLLPGQYARALIVTGHVQALAIPESAVLHRGEVTAVYVLDAEDHALLRQVRLGEPAGGGRIEVLAGLKAAERVALDPIRAGIQASGSSSRRS